MNIPANLKYTKDHEWISIDGDVATIGITDFMANIFTSQFIPIVAARGLALASLQWLPPLKNSLARQMMFGKR
jgi:hypothetical protein